MKSKQNSFEEQPELSITPSLVMEYLFCPRFIYFMECLKIPQHEERRFKVQQGRQVHENRTRINKEYVRKKIGCIDKEISVYLSSLRHRVRGILDEVLFMKDGTLAPLEYKFAQYKERLFNTYKHQLVLQAWLITGNYQKQVNRGYIVFVRSKNYLLKVPLSERDFDETGKIIDDILEIIHSGRFPKKTASRAKCIDCCYRKICV
ncbi:CRISPR-associated protein Cas4 [candidate division KSB1 bacterium]|nr:CRISPR-associated protein Cas4 [candidate division KSB1 bacterium]